MLLDFATAECPACDGDGMGTADPDGPACARCAGSGRVLECTECGGLGSHDVDYDWSGQPTVEFCDHCEGSGAEPMPDPNDRY